MNIEGRTVLTVSELNAAVKDRLESDLRFQNLCVGGELSNYKIYPSGHHYFTLKDQENSLRCVMFRSSAQRLRYHPENGMKVSAVGSLRVYPRDGAYQLYVNELLPEGTGELQIAFEQLKQKLYAEGLFDPAHKKLLPAFPDRVAIITSSAGAAVHDMIRIFGRRWPMTKLLLLPVRVQGIEAPPEIAGAIRYANEFHVADLIITGRGGGSLEDLWAFNDERVARAIFASEIPVISAVGHEPDVTISDFVADARASTPSNAAEIAVPDQEEIAELLMGSEMRLVQAMNRTLSHARQQMAGFENKKVLTDAGSFVNLRQLELDRLQEQLSAAMRETLLQHRNQLGRQAAALDAMSPLKVLGRGYALVIKEEDRLIRSVSSISIGDRLRLQLADGTADCRVEARREKENG